jgi:hypothetical protein
MAAKEPFSRGLEMESSAVDDKRVKIIFLTLAQESCWTENSQPGATYEVFVFQVMIASAP